MLKNKLDKAAYDALTSAEVKAEYVPVGMEYILQHDEDSGELKRALDRSTKRETTLTDRLSAVEGELGTLKTEATRKGSPAEIAAAAREEALKDAKPKLERAERLETRLKTTELSRTARELATKIGGEKNVVALLPHITSRLAVTLDENDEPIVVVNDIKGVATKLKTDELVTELKANKDLAPLVHVAVGSGGQGKQPGKPGSFTPQSPASTAGEKNLGNMNDAERKAYIQSTYIEPAAANA